MTADDVTLKARQMLAGIGVPADAVTPRSLAGIGVILLLLYVYAFSLLLERSSAGAAALTAARANLDQQVATLNDPAWPDRRTEALAQVTSLRARLWPGETAGIARASYQQWVGTVLRQVGIAQAPNFQSAGSGVPGIEAYQAIVNTMVTPEQVLALLDALAGQKALIEVTNLEFNGAPSPRISLTLSSFIRLPDGQDTTAPARGAP